MRVLHLGAGNMYGGIESLLVTLARERTLCPQMVPEFGLCFEGGVSSELRATGVSVQILGNVRFSRPWTIWNARRRLRRLVSEDRPDVIVTHACWPHSVFGAVTRRVGIPTILWVHDVSNPNHWLDRRAARIVPDRIIANSAFTASTLPLLYKKVPTKIIHAPVRARTVSSEVRPSVRGRFGASPNSVVILMVARMDELKGHETLLSALAKLGSNPKWQCWIVGSAQTAAEETYLGQLRQSATRSGLDDRVNWLGSRTDVAELFAAADIYCQPNHRPDSFGLTFIEALYARLPIVTTAIGGAAEIVDESCGILVQPKSAEQLAVALTRLIDDPIERSKLSQQGINRAESLCEPSRQLSSLYDWLANGCPKMQ